MNNVFNVLSATIICFSFLSIKNTNKNEQYLSSISNASLYDSQINQLFSSLNSGTVNDLYIDDYYQGVYFSNLRENIGNNRYGSCSYVAIGMLLSFYDSYWNDDFIPENYDKEPISTFVTCPSTDFGFPSFYAESPGIAFEPSNDINSLSLEDYLYYVTSNSNTYFQCKLISLSQTYFGTQKFESESNPFGMTFADISAFFSYYLYEYRNFTTSQVLIDSCNDANLVRSYAINKIKNGIPVVLRSQSSSLGGHAFIAYDYDEGLDEIYVHTGWRDDVADKTLSHVPLSSTGFTTLCDAISLNILMPSSFSYNYHSISGGNGSARNFIFPQDIEITSGNYRDELPTFKWKSIYKEKWIEDYNPYFDFSILDQSSNQTFKIEEINLKQLTLTQNQWDTTLSNGSNTYYAYVELDSDTYPYWDDYYTKKSFSKPLEYNQIPQIKPNEYGFADAYPSDDTTKNTFIGHTASHNFAFETRRYRTGYIHDEYIVMSPIRNGFKEAFIEYRFSYAVTRIDVELAHWRETSHEWLTNSTGEASVQYYWENQWVDKLDLLSSSTALPTNRNSHEFYKIEFENPIYRVRFRAETFSINTNDSNRGRICIGDMAFYPSEYNLPLSGGELDYEPSSWNDTVISQFLWFKRYLREKANCYSYAVNAQRNPTTNSLEFMQPGQASETNISNDDILNINYIISLIESDANILGFRFDSINDNEKCPQDCYKVAFVIDNQYQSGDYFRYDYHWYRQNSDGTWSHKPGGKPVTKFDNSGKIIMDPRTADRNAGSGLNYNYFVGFFVIKPLNIYY